MILLKVFHFEFLCSVKVFMRFHSVRSDGVVGPLNVAQQLGLPNSLLTRGHRRDFSGSTVTGVAAHRFAVIQSILLLHPPRINVKG